MKIYLLRHGDAMASGERPLSDRGIRETTSSAQGLKALGVKPTLVVHSPLVRACQTAEIVTGVLGVKSESVVETDLLVPGGDRGQLLHEIRRIAENNEDSIIIVGHLPSLGELLCYLVWGEPVREVPLKKSSACFLETRDSTVRKNGALLRWLLTPGQLARIARSEG